MSYGAGIKQPEKEKIEALKTLLPLVGVYLSRMREAKCVQTYGQSEVIPGPPPPGWSVLDCDGHCARCEYQKQCGGEWWEVEMNRLNRQYHLGIVSGAWLRLEAFQPRLALAVHDLYIEDPDRSLVITESGESQERRRKLGLAGLRWMATHIRVDLTPFYEKPRSTEDKVKGLLEDGITSSFVIACRLGVSIRRVQQVRAALKVRQE